jgi:glycosyltransferase involved in cell wall biosynthesis
MKINWFSPLPPAKTSIADDYLVGLLPALSREAELTLWTDQRSWDPMLEKSATVRHYKPDQISWPELNQADINFYNLGNNHIFHASIWQVSRQHSGIVILHDLRMHNFFDSLYRAQWRDVSGYLDQMKRHYGDEGLDAASEFVNGRLGIDFMTEHYPFTSLALENCLGVVVHTEEAFEQLERSKQWPVMLTTLPRSIPPSRDAEERAATPGPPYRLIIFGYIGRNRRLNAVLEALSGMPERDCFRLDIFGELADARGLRSRIRQLDLGKLVQLHGYAPEDQLNKALVNSHLAINLRYPTMGEASGSQLRIWYHALPSLVTDVGWYSSLSSDTVVHVRHEHEISDIRTHLKAFLSEPERFAAMGREGLRTLERLHNPEEYVHNILEMARDRRRMTLTKAARDLAKRAGTAMGSWTSKAGNDPRRIAEHISELFKF